MQIKNLNLNKSIDFDDKIFILNLKDLGVIEASHFTSKSVNQSGETLENSNLGVREVNIVGYIIEDISKNKRDLIKFINPLHDLDVVIDNYKIKGRATSTVQFTDDYTTNNENLCKFNITIFCNNPFFEDLETTLVYIATWEGGLVFPFSSPFNLKRRGETKKNIYNNGDIETPVKIIFKGPATNPRILNATTGEYIKLNRTLSSDDTLIINTEFGNKTVEIIRQDGSIENAFNFIDLNSTFFSLEIGDNIIEYSTDSLEPESVQIIYKNRYLDI